MTIAYWCVLAAIMLPYVSTVWAKAFPDQLAAATSSCPEVLRAAECRCSTSGRKPAAGTTSAQAGTGLADRARDTSCWSGR